MKNIVTVILLMLTLGLVTACNNDNNDNDPATVTYYQDVDGDGYGDPAISQVATTQPAGYVSNNNDCDDGNPRINPGAAEAYDGVDNNCNGLVDEGFSTYYRDADGDGYGDPAISQVAAVQPAGYVQDNTDCDDGVAGINPGAVEVSDGIDNNCNGQIDEGLVVYYQDADGDGYGDPAVSQTAAVQPAGYVLDNTDCDDGAAAVNPGAVEVSDGIDNNCDGQIDEGLVTYYQDADGDGYGDPAISQVAAAQPAGYVLDNTDCDDGAAAVNPGATEINDGIDNNCDGQVDEGFGSDASLSDLTLSAGALDQAFQSGQYSYTATVSYTVTSTVVTPTTSDANATVTVDGTAVNSGSASGSISLIEGDNTITVVVTAEDGTTTQPYTVTVTRQTAQNFAQQAYIKASNTGAGDQFGYSVALSVDTLVVGAFNEDGDATSTGVSGTDNNNRNNAGAAYVFVRNGGVWTQQAYLKASNPTQSAWFGHSVTVEGDTIAVGSPLYLSDYSGAVYIFTRSGTTWTQQAFLRPSNIGSNDRFGDSVALSGGTLAIGAYAEDGDASSTLGNTNDNLLNSGAVYVFTGSGANWTQQAYIKAFNAGSADAFSERSLALEGDTLVVGAWGEDGDSTSSVGSPNNSASGAGAVYVYTRTGTVWSLEAYLKASNAAATDAFGYSVSLDADTLAVGAVNEDGDANSTVTVPNEAAYNSGAVYIFTRSGGAWSQQAYLKASTARVSDWFGSAVSLSGDTLLVGAYFEDGDASSTVNNLNDFATDAGAAYVFTRSGTDWSQQAYIKASNAGYPDRFGYSVALDNDTMAVGAIYEASAATGVDGDQSDNSAGQSGAVYIFQ